MTNFERIKNMTVDEMTENNVKGLMIPNGYRVDRIFICTDGFQTYDKDEAIQYEINWLNSEREASDEQII